MVERREFAEAGSHIVKQWEEGRRRPGLSEALDGAVGEVAVAMTASCTDSAAVVDWELAGTLEVVAGLEEPAKVAWRRG